MQLRERFNRHFLDRVECILLRAEVFDGDEGFLVRGHLTQIFKCLILAQNIRLF